LGNANHSFLAADANLVESINDSTDAERIERHRA
jgi:hypothetical protein